MLFRSLDGKDLRHHTTVERKNILRTVLPAKKSNIRYSDHIKGQAKEFLHLACEQKLEGIISKRADSPYMSGRHDNWMKSKCVAQQEFVIGGYVEGTGHREALGALLLGVYEKKKLRFCGKCGTGFNQKTLATLQKVFKPLEQDDSPFDLNSPRGKGIHWLKPKLSAEISFAEWTSDGRLRVPVFKGLREDKPAKQIHTEKPVHNEKSMRLTSPERIVYPQEKLTKGDIAKYYEQVSPLMIEQIHDRPLSLVRCPVNTKQKCFFQKHMTGKMPDNIDTVRIKEKSATETYMTLASPEAVAELVQMSSFEFHVWNCRNDNIEHPDQFIVDFDPGPGVSWQEVIDAAFELKDLLDHLKLKSFVNVSGGKGLHVHVPIAQRYTWDQVKNFTQALARQMEADDPDRFISKMTKEKRKPGWRMIQIDHGTVSSYTNRRCRCAQCKAAWAEYTRDHRRKVKDNERH